MVLRFYEAVDARTAPIRMVFLKALFLTALATGNRCAELDHFSRRALVDSGTTLTLGVMPRFLYKTNPRGFLLLPLSSRSLVRTWPCARFWPSALTRPKQPLCLTMILCSSIRSQLLHWSQAGLFTGWSRPFLLQTSGAPSCVPIMFANLPLVLNGLVVLIFSTFFSMASGPRRTRF